jgi:uncharacterized protein YyaL (SSP411 family)
MNHLAGQKSPYLLQHADNPVDWYPWGDEAFEKARREQKPIFLSIGYSTCHWCHVMERESFADEQVARLMNAVFVSIKVDREERPDLDEHFMDVSRLLTGGGGWPLTIVMTPERRPFFAGTYIPREAAYGRMGMLELVPRIHDLCQSRREDIEKSADEIDQHLAGLRTETAGGLDPFADAADRAVGSFAALFDRDNGGFGGAPKFPMPSVFPLLLSIGQRTGSADALHMVEKTLLAMRNGGIFDQVGFGFHRYSTDGRWLVPHFEKMLYDQAQLAMAYTDAWLATGNDGFRRTAQETLGYMLRDLLLPEGAFASAEDADSEGGEGAFYLWTASEIEQALGPDAEDFSIRYRVLSRGNYVEQHGPTGRNILHRDPGDTAAPGFVEEKLRRLRERRPRPSRDDKILTDWNGLAIAALARAGRAFGEPSRVQSGVRAARFILERLRSRDGRLYHRWRDGEAAIPGFADDYAFLAWGLLELYEASREPAWLRECLAVMRAFIDGFWDPEGAGFFQTGPDTEPGLPRRKSLTDGVVPSANSAAALVLMKLNHLTGELDFQRRAEGILRLYPAEAADNAISWAAALTAADFARGPTAEVVIAGERDAPDTQAFLRALDTAYLPRTVVLLRNPADPDIAVLAPFTAALKGSGAGAAAFVCLDFSCRLPTSDPQVMLRQLSDPGP